MTVLKELYEIASGNTIQNHMVIDPQGHTIGIYSEEMACEYLAMYDPDIFADDEDLFGENDND